MTDTRIVYGARCVWWGDIREVGGRDVPGSNHKLPCCPQCGGVLFQIDNPKDWWAGVDAYEAEGREGYRGLVEWSRGKCFPSMKEAAAVYATETGRSVTL